MHVLRLTGVIYLSRSSQLSRVVDQLRIREYISAEREKTRECESSRPRERERESTREFERDRGRDFELKIETLREHERVTETRPCECELASIDRLTKSHLTA